MNIKDNKFHSLEGIIFIAPDGELIPGEFHAPYVSSFFGLHHSLPEEKRKENAKRYELYNKYCDQYGFRSIDLINFFIQFFGYDRTTPYGIITAKENPYSTYYNWLIEGYMVDTLREIRLDEEKGFYYPSQNFETIDSEIALKEKALSIYENTPTLERKLHYK